MELKTKNYRTTTQTGLLFPLLLLLLQTVQGQTLGELLAEAERNNPSIQSAELRYRIAGEKIEEVNSLPETELGAGIFVSEPETRTGAQKLRLTARQMFPWFGTITARENYAAAMAEAEYQELAIAKRKLVLQLSQLYYNLYEIRASQGVLQENIDLLSTYERLALTSVEVGKASAVDVLRLQIRQNELFQRRQVLEEEFRATQAAANNLINRKEGIAILMVDSLDLPERDILEADSLSVHPELLKYDHMYESVLQAEELNRKEAAPRIGVGLDYVSVAERPDMDFSDNGKDIIMPMLSFSVPIFTKSYSSRTRQNELRQQEVLSQRQERLNTLQTMLARARADLNAARIAYETHNRNLEQARDAEGILVRNYETGTIDFNDVLDIQELQLKFQLNRITAIKNYYMQTAVISYLSS